MNFETFKRKIQQYPVFSSSHIGTLGEDPTHLRVNLTRWRKKGLILSLKKGLYVLNQDDRKIPISKLFIANQLMNPSYLSLEYVLSFYGLIPERTIDITSITTKKTITFSNSLGKFTYQHLQPKCFSGFIQIQDENKFPIFIAEPEKAIVDFFYLNLSLFQTKDIAVFEHSYRFQNTADLSQEKLKRYADLFMAKKLRDVVDAFCVFVRNEKT